MKRFRELLVGVRNRYPTDDFFADFESSCRDYPDKKRLYRSYDEALMLLDDDSWKVLKEKAIEHFRSDARAGQRKQGFFNQLNEAFAYRHLIRQGFTDVRFLRETKTEKRPDIRFLERGVESYCEVKTMGITDEEISRREGHSAYDGSVYLELSMTVLEKLAGHINRAWKQIHSLGENDLVFVLMRFDDIALDHYSRYRKQLIQFCRSRGFKNMVIKVTDRGNKRICIR